MRNKEIKIFLFEVILYDISIQKLGRVGPLQQWSRQYRANIPIIKGKKRDFSRNATIFKLLTKLLVCCVCFFAIFLCDSNILGLVDLSIRVRLFTNLIKGHWSTVEKKIETFTGHKEFLFEKTIGYHRMKDLEHTNKGQSYLPSTKALCQEVLQT